MTTWHAPVQSPQQTNAAHGAYRQAHFTHVYSASSRPRENRKPNRRITRQWRAEQALGALLAVLLSLTLALSTSLSVSMGAPASIAAREHTGEVRGYLAGRHDRHYLGLQVEERFATVHLTLTVNYLGAPRIAQDNNDQHGIDQHDKSPASIPDPHADNYSVNFLVLTELGLQRFLGGADPWDVNLAAGTLTADADGAIKLESRFRAVGRGGYTVLIYNSSDTPATYHLRVAGGHLIDHAGQTFPAGFYSLPDGGLQTISRLEPGDVRFGRPAATLTALPVTALGRPSGLPIRREVLGGTLAAKSRPQASLHHYFVLEPDTHARDITLSLAYTADTQTSAADFALDIFTGGVNFWVFTEAGLRQLEQGAPADFLSLASGAAFLGVPNLLRTKVRLTGETAFVVVVFNQTGQAVDYRLRVEGGALVDLYGQSQEAQSVEASALRDELAPMESLAQASPLFVQPLLPDSGTELELVVPPAIAKQLENTPGHSESAPQEPHETDEQSSQSDTLLEDGKIDETSDETRDETGENASEDRLDTDEPAQPEGSTDGETQDQWRAPGEPTPYRLPLFHTGYFDNLLMPSPAANMPVLENLAIEGATRQVYTVQPDGAFARVIITLDTTPEAAGSLSHIHIWAVSKEGMRRVEAGVAPMNAAVAGFTVLRLGRDQSVLQASFDAAGYEPYALIVENRSPTPTSYRLNVRNGVFLPADTSPVATPVQ